MFPNALLADQETQDDSEIYSVVEAKRKLSAELGRYRDGQLGVSVEADISGGNSDTSASKTQIGRDAGVRSFWNCTAGLRPRTTIRRPCVI